MTQGDFNLPFLSLDGLSLHYSVTGPLDRRPVIAFANSLGTDFRIWNAVADLLAADYTLVRYDKRGHGLSDTGTVPYTMSDHIGDLAALLDALTVRRAVICGLSVGGMIAQGLAAQRPDLVRALVLCDTAQKIGDDALWNARIEAVTEYGVASISGPVLDRWFSPGFRAGKPAEWAGYRNMLERTPKEGYAATCQAIRDTDYTVLAASIPVPVLCVVGEHDGATPPPLVAELAGLIPGARFEEIAGAGHLPCIEQPEVLAGLIGEFLREPERAAP